MKIIFSIFLFLAGIKNLAFRLSPESNSMCFFLWGNNLGKDFKMKYEVIGKKPENVKFGL